MKPGKRREKRAKSPTIGEQLATRREQALAPKRGGPPSRYDPALEALQEVKKSDPAGYPRFARLVHRDLLAGGIYGGQTKDASASEAFKESAWRYAIGNLNDMKPKDPIEEMLVMQALWTHARVAKLSGLAVQQSNLQALEIINGACDRAANSFRRLALALSEYRHPRSGDQFVAIKQANLADQQVIQNLENRNLPAENVTNEKGSDDGGETAPKAIPSQPNRAAIAEGLNPPGEAVAVGHRPPDARRKGEGQNERSSSRRTVSRGRGRPP